MKFRLQVLLVLVAASVLFGRLEGIAQTAPFTISVEKPDRELSPGGFTTFEIVVHNTSSDSIGIRVVRTVNALPDTSWHSSVCSEFHCYDEVVSVLPAVTVQVGDSTEFKMHVQAGAQIDAEAKVTLRFDTGDGTDSLSKAFSVKVVVPPEPIFRLNVVESEKTVDPGQTAEFLVGSLNVSNTPLAMRMHRVENNFPDQSWSSWLCDDDSCYLPQISETPTVTVDPAHGVYYTLKVKAGSTGGAPAKVTLRFDAGEGVDPIYQQFIVHVATLGVESKLDPMERLAAYPNPATSFAIIPLPTSGAMSRSARLTLYDIAGRPVADFSTEAQQAMATGIREVSVNLSGLAGGLYSYRFSLEGRYSDGWLAIVR